MKANRPESPRILKSDLVRVDACSTGASDYEELPELSDDMLKRGIVKRAGRPVAANPRRQVTIRLPESVLAAWKATGPGWQTRMAELLDRRAP